jgi:NAD(P)-dependent dehydrogenase (short-subunit alcohol dehydrogenase family)
MAKEFGKTSTTEDVLSGVDLKGKRILVTGVSSGLGLETARAFVAHGAFVVGVVRDLTRGEATTDEVRRAAAANAGDFELIEIDLGNLTSVRAGTAALLAAGKPFDVVIANAGVLATPFERTVDGFERQFGTNYLGHFVLINRIEPLIRDGGRVVALSTVGHMQSNVDLDDPNFEHTPYDRFLASARSKTAIVLFTTEFDKRHKVRGVRAAAVHPGGIQTDIGRYMEAAVLEALYKAISAQLAAEGKELEMKSIPQGAATTVWAAIVATGDEVGGQYCEDCHVSKVVLNDAKVGILAEGVRAYALDPANAEALWRRSEELVGETF